MRKFLQIFTLFAMPCASLLGASYKVVNDLADEIEITQSEKVPALSCCFYEEKNKLLFVGAKNLFAVFDSQTLEKKFAIFERCFGKVNAISADSKHAYFACGSFNIGKILKVSLDEKIVDTLKEFQDEVLSLAISNDSKFLAAACANGTLFVFDLEENKEILCKKISNGKIVSVDFSQNSKSLICAIAGGEISVFEAEDNFATPQTIFVNDVLQQAVFMQNSQTAFALISGYANSAKMYVSPRIRQRDVKQNDLQNFNLSKIISRKTQKMLFCATLDGKILSLRTSAKDAFFKTFDEVKSPLTSLCEAPLGVFATSIDGKIFFWQHSGILSCGIEILNEKATETACWVTHGSAFSENEKSVRFKKSGVEISEGNRAKLFSAELFKNHVAYKTIPNYKGAKKQSPKKDSKKSENKRSKKA